MESCETMQLQNPHVNLDFSEEDLNRIIEMGWEDRTTFEAIERQFGINQDGVIKIMRANLKRNSFKLWRKRTHGQTTKHAKLRGNEVTRHQSKQHNKMYR
jgi:uncharacterized protein (TIGR03643 family)